MTENSLIIILISAVFFSIQGICVRRAVYITKESFTSTATSTFLGVIFFAASVSVSGEWSKLWSLSGQGVILLGAAGIIHFVAGRLLVYNAFRLIGANKAGALSRTNPIYAVMFGVIFLNESLTIFLVLGVLCIVTGAVLIGLEKESVSGVGRSGFSSTEAKGILAALGGAVCFGTSAVLIRPVVEEVGSPFIGAFVSYVAASVVMAFFFVKRGNRQQMARLRLFPSAIIYLMTGGISISIAQLLKYTALVYSPASIVVPLLSISVLFAFFLSLLINRKIEVFTLKVISGILCVLAGTFIIFYWPGLAL